MVLAAKVGSAPVLQAPVIQAPVLPAPVVLSVIYAVLLQIQKCRNLRISSANFWGPNLYLCYSNCFFCISEYILSNSPLDLHSALYKVGDIFENKSPQYPLNICVHTMLAAISTSAPSETLFRHPCHTGHQR